MKSVTDTLGYRTGDQLGAWSYGGLHSLVLDLSSISFVALSGVGGWGVLCLWLGKRQIALAAARETAGDETISPATGARP